MFKVGQTVVHLAYGIGTIKSIETRQFGDKKSEFYIMEIPDYDAPKKVFVPLDSAEQRLRLVVSQAEAEEVLNYIAKAKPSIQASTWNRRYREYMELIATGSLMDLAMVYLDLREIQKEKDLSFGERKMLQVVKDRIETELKTGLNKKVDLACIQ